MNSLEQLELLSGGGSISASLPFRVSQHSQFQLAGRLWLRFLEHQHKASNDKKAFQSLSIKVIDRIARTS